jgi:hypothetical protein
LKNLLTQKQISINQDPQQQTNMSDQLNKQLDALFGPEDKPAKRFEDQEFYMLHVEGGAAPTVKHATIGDARKEAERLVKKEGKPVYLLKASDVCLPDPKLDVLSLVEKANTLGQQDIAQALLTCALLVDAAKAYMPQDEPISRMWFETASVIKL